MVQTIPVGSSSVERRSHWSATAAQAGAVCCLGMAIWLTVSVSPSGLREPSLVAAQAELDLGSVELGSTVPFEFVLRNQATVGPVRIVAVHPDCGCLVPRIERDSLAVGETIRLQGVWKADGAGGSVRRGIVLEFINPDGSLAVLPLSLSGEVRLPWVANPDTLVLLHGPTGVAGDVTLSARSDGPAPKVPLLRPVGVHLDVAGWLAELHPQGADFQLRVAQEDRSTGEVSPEMPEWAQVRLADSSGNSVWMTVAIESPAPLPEKTKRIKSP